ncbi:hypothetical protein BDN72DRAFT_671920 [Pluteus cervinus]|uniref:Uncharacterized protein n=1 Tax=Pluteus cervinus TaxID=181527 RepID=A0ACD3BA29_9AGAR|nr:hypothetical protein BDN72DRAFT_671920 [Pluteus cervinus]
MKLTVSEEAISLLLRIFYNPTYSEFSFNTTEWASVLEFAHGYEFEEVKKLALRELEKQPLDVADRIQLYEEQKADVSLVIPYYFDISTRPHILSRGEARTLGLDASLTIHECREHSRVTVKKGPKENGAAGKRGNAGAGEPVVIEFDHSIVIAHLARCLLVDPAFVKDRLTKTNRIPGSDQPAA